MKALVLIGSQPAIVGVQGFGESAIVLGVRYWVPTQRYVQASYAANLAMWQELMRAGVTIPFPQRDVHLARRRT